jgi:hypothetical protein
MADNNTAGIFVAIPAIVLLLLVSFSSPPTVCNNNNGSTNTLNPTITNITNNTTRRAAALSSFSLIPELSDVCYILHALCVLSLSVITQTSFGVGHHQFFLLRQWPHTVSRSRSYRYCTGIAGSNVLSICCQSICGIAKT